MSITEIEKIREQHQEHQEDLISAKTVQEGMLPKRRHFSRLFNDYFVLYHPKKVISGDFYWTGEKHGLKYLVVGDCNGHGVSAALLSVLMLNLFEYTIMNKGIKKTHKILQEIDKKFIESFKNNSASNFNNPWVELSIVCVNEAEKKVYYSTANRKILFTDTLQKATVLQGSKYPLGGWKMEANRTFSAQSFSYKEGDSIYLGSDGFQDQAGGSKNRKYQSKALHHFIEKNNGLTFDKQLEQLEHELEHWKQGNKQTDDICIVGIEL